jgi:hypothetical protein
MKGTQNPLNTISRGGKKQKKKTRFDSVNENKRITIESEISISYLQYRDEVERVRTVLFLKSKNLTKIQ